MFFFPITVSLFFSKSLNGSVICANPGMNFVSCFTAPKYDLNSFQLLGFIFSETPRIFSFSGFIPFSEKLNLSQFISFCAIFHFSSLSCSFLFSYFLKTSPTFSSCVSLVPFVNIDMSSIKTNTIAILIKMSSITR